jgi:hypothetical protein
VNSSSCKVSGKRTYSSEDRSTIGILSEGPPSSKTTKCRQREETSGGNPSGGSDPDKDGGGVEALLREEESSFEGERERLVPLLSSIVVK